jgi:hypothetical protein
MSKQKEVGNKLIKADQLEELQNNNQNAKVQALINLKIAKENDAKKIANGYRWTRIDVRTEVLRK